ncbi:MAG: glucose-6-phosphate dehydrogenase assembly protein OpcA [Dermatophilus congolensis]|nr:glucose-6-phosphate dehydrogenase assembly protein OpcA [Dermatophilus congolensis]
MIIDLPATSIQALMKKIVSLREDTGALALGRVMTLVVMAEEAGIEPVLREANNGTRQHPSRIIVVVEGNRRGSNRLDAQIRIGGDAGASEMVVLRLYGDLTKHGESVVTPLLLADSPIVAWWPRTAPRDVANHPIGRFAQRRITDAETQPDPIKSMAVRAKHYEPGDTDLAWTRTTRWRGVLASLLDEPPYEEVTSAEVMGNKRSASADLLAGWLQVRLDIPVKRSNCGDDSEGIYGVTLERTSGTTTIVRPDGVIGEIDQPGKPHRRISLPRRNDSECLADELSRLDADETYASALRDGIPALAAKKRKPNGSQPIDE